MKNIKIIILILSHLFLGLINAISQTPCEDDPNCDRIETTISALGATRAWKDRGIKIKSSYTGVGSVTVTMRSANESPVSYRCVENETQFPLGKILYNTTVGTSNKGTLDQGTGQDGMVYNSTQFGIGGNLVCVQEFEYSALHPLGRRIQTNDPIFYQRNIRTYDYATSSLPVFWRFSDHNVAVIIEIKYEGGMTRQAIEEFNLPGRVWKPAPIIDTEDAIIYINEFRGGDRVRYANAFGSGTNTASSTINAEIGDEITFKIKRSLSNALPDVVNLPDTWLAVFSREVHYMSSKSIRPGQYRPRIPYRASFHYNSIVPIGTGDNPIGAMTITPTTQQDHLKYPDWTIEGDYYVLRWTLNRAMDANQTTQPNDAPWWSAAGKLRNPADCGGCNQRAGKLQGTDMVALSVLRGDATTKYPGFSYTNYNYWTTSDKDDVFYDRYPIGSQAGYRNPPVGGKEPWQTIPSSEMDNSINEIVTWYQIEKSKDDPEVTDLPSSYVYEGYEIWEGLSDSPYSGSDTWNNTRHTYNYQTSQQSKAPGRISLNIRSGRNTNTLNWNINVATPVTGDKFFNISGDVNLIGDNSQSDTYTMSALKAGSGGTFNLVYNEWNGKGVRRVNDIFDENDRSVQFQVRSKGGNALTAYYKKYEDSEPAIIGGIDLAATKLNLIRCNNFANANESRGLSPREFPRLNRSSDENYDITSFSGNIPSSWRSINMNDGTITPLEYIQFGYTPNFMHGFYTVGSNTTLNFRVFDNSTYNFKSSEGSVNFYSSNRLELKRMIDSDLSSETTKPNHVVRWELNRINPTTGSSIASFQLSNGATQSINTSTYGSGHYILTATYGNTSYHTYIHVLSNNEHGTNNFHKAKVIRRDLTAKERGWLGLSSSQASGYKLMVLTDYQSEYVYNDMSVRARPNGGTPIIDRFGPFNDYADHYKYKINNGSLQSSQTVSLVNTYINSKNNSYGQYNFDVNYHMDPLNGLSTFNSYSINNLTESRIQTIFNRWPEGSTQRRSPWEVSVPWFSESMYHGLILRNVNKPLMDVGEWNDEILKGNYDRYSAQAPSYFSDLDEDDEKLEYEFYLNLLHNRWVLVQSSVDEIEFRHFDTNVLMATYDVNNGGSGARIAKEDEVLSAEEDVFKSLTIYPNPNDGNMTAEFINTQKGYVNYQVMDLNGKILIRDEFEANEGLVQLSIQTRGILKTGVYLFKFSSGEFESTQRVVIE